jgi:hypothetical protein
MLLFALLQVSAQLLSGTPLYRLSSHDHDRCDMSSAFVKEPHTAKNLQAHYRIQKAPTILPGHGHFPCADNRIL